MSDLISRSELIKLINNKYIGLNDAVDLYHGGIFDCFKEIKLMIKKQQTAYDIDKVVEELEEIINPKELNFCRVSKGRCIHDEDDIGCIDCLAQKAIEIVKKGCVSDDVCEWRLCDEEENVYDTSCRNPHILIEGTPKENNYEYCPYCGKKIKVGGENGTDNQ